jgi:trans-aconitate methyltransferase
MGTFSNAWDAQLYSTRHNFVFQYGEGLLPLLQAQAGERILDLGCGTGELTAKIAAAGARVTALDSSAAMLERARAAHPGVEFIEADARSFDLAGKPFDAIFSNAVLHWIPEAAAVAARCLAHLRPGGRLVVEFGGAGNVAQVIAAAQTAGEELGFRLTHPWYYPTIGAYAAVLEGAGFAVDSAQLFDRPTRLEDPETGLRDWLTMFGAAVLAPVPADGREEFWRRFEAAARPRLFRDGAWFADYRRLRVVAHRPE